MADSKTYPLEEALKAQQALRAMAGLGPEMFPVEAFIGMVSDEIESLRKIGKTDAEIASAINRSSKIDITVTEIAKYYAPPDQRRH